MKQWAIALLILCLAFNGLYLVFSARLSSDAAAKEQARAVELCTKLFIHSALDNFGAKLSSAVATKDNVVLISYTLTNISNAPLITYCGISGDAVVMNPNIETLNILLGN
tara:strand:+ start:1207 stop:1536 length:330 start_codon:yes stop_codon:yes gene_type:complete